MAKVDQRNNSVINSVPGFAERLPRVVRRQRVQS